MFKNKISFCDLEEIIDRHIENESNMCIICNDDLKEEIAEYLCDEYDLADDNEVTDCYEYYITLNWFDGECDLIIENAVCSNGEYKHSFASNIDFFIFTDMDSGIVSRKIFGDKMYCELIDCGECENCMEDDAEVDFILSKAEELLNRDFCPECAIQFISDIFVTGKTIGFDECRLKMQEYLGSFDGGLLP